MTVTRAEHPHPHDHDHADGHDHPHPHDHGHGHNHGHDHSHGGGVFGWIATVMHWHGHEHEEEDLTGDPAFATDEGIRTVWIALGALAVTTVLQFIIVWFSGSVALLADTVHNLGDMLNSVPLLIAFYLARRVANRRYTYGYGRAEDVAGILIVFSIIFSAGYIFWESFRKLLDPQPIEQLPWVAAAAIVGFLGNEVVAWFQIRAGNRIGSASLIADGLHARIDGLTSLVVLVAVAGSALGFPIVDPLVGILIGVTIVFIAKDATVRIWHRLMDAVDPGVVDEIEHLTGHVAGVERVASVRARWVGHELHAEIQVELSGAPSLVEAQRTVEETRRSLVKGIRHLSVVTIEAVPAPGA